MFNRIPSNGSNFAEVRAAPTAPSRLGDRR